LSATHHAPAQTLPAPAQARLDQAQRLLGHRFARTDLLAEALTHRSAALGRARAAARRRKTPKSTGAGSNERLEFVGDRVLGLLIAEWISERFPDEQEGKLGLRMAVLVSRDTLAEAADRIGLAELLNLGANEALAGVNKLATVLADAMEASIGALYFDGGLEAARRFVRATWQPLMDQQKVPPKDPKNALQERVTANGGAAPEYKVISSQGPSHAPHFVITVTARGLSGTGEGATKRAAERLAAAELLGKLK
jgi:ribonuclease-3